MKPDRFDPQIHAGSKLLLGLIGSGIGRSLAPVVQEAEAAHHGLRAHYQIIDTADATDPQVLPKLIESAQRMGFAGLNITFPFKQAVLALLDEVDPTARAMNAVNCVTFQHGRSKGYNTDSAGWAWGFVRELPNADLSDVVVLGCGGAGSAVSFAVLGLGAKRVTLVDEDRAKAQALCAALGQHFGVGRARVVDSISAAMQTATGLVHATPTGMLKLPGMALEPELLQAPMWVADLVYVPLETELLKAARAKGCAVHDGGHMNVGQGILNFKLFTGREPDAARMAAHFHQLIAA